MAGFTADGIVEPLDYDFTAIPGLSDLKGTIKETSQAQVGAYLKSARAEVERLTEAVNGAAGSLTGGGVIAVLSMAFRAESLGPDA